MTPTDQLARIVQKAASHNMRHLLDATVGAYDGIVIAAASGLIADHMFRGLDQIGVRPVAVVDNKPSLWNSTVNEALVLPPARVVSDYPNALYVAALFSHTPFRRQLQSLGARHVVSYAPFFHKYPDTFLPYFAVDKPTIIAAEAVRVEEAAAIWADDASRALYLGILDWFSTLDSMVVPEPSSTHDTYFPEVLTLRQDEIFVDCGAYDGDTVEAFLKNCNRRYKSIVAIEPDPQNFVQLSRRVHGLDRVVLVNAAVGAERGRTAFVAAGAPASHATSAGANGVAARGDLVDVEVVKLDDLVPSPTYVKMDIEGFELEALAGARALLAGEQTAFAITLYHRMSDLWQIPLFVHETAPNLQLYLRHYAEDWAETICYAIPFDRTGSRQRLL